MSAAILEGRTLRAYTDGLGRLSAVLFESAALEASGGAASGLTHRPDSEDTGAAGGHPVHLLTGDTDDPTMEEHLALHPEDALCPICEADPDVMPRCPRCLGDGRRGEDCPFCGGEYCHFYGDLPYVCASRRCRLGRLVEATR